MEQAAAAQMACASACLNDLEDVVNEKGGIRVLLDEKRRKVSTAVTPRDLFADGDMKAA